MTKGVIHTPVESKAGRRLVRAKGSRTAYEIRVVDRAELERLNCQKEWNAKIERDKSAKGK